MSCARRAKGSVKLRSPMVLCTYGSGRARGEREKQGPVINTHHHVGQACCGRACRIRENAVTFLEWGESRSSRGAFCVRSWGEESV
jgi:hypothetical protein